MPIYEFICTDCHDSFEQLLSYSATQEPACPACGSEQARRKLSAPAIHFKGSGFYLTESRKEAKSKSDKETPDTGESKLENDAGTGDKSQDSSSDSGNESQSDSSRSDRKPAKSDSVKSKIATHDA